MVIQATERFQNQVMGFKISDSFWVGVDKAADKFYAFGYSRDPESKYDPPSFDFSANDTDIYKAIGKVIYQQYIGEIK